MPRCPSLLFRIPSIHIYTDAPTDASTEVPQPQCFPDTPPRLLLPSLSVASILFRTALICHPAGEADSSPPEPSVSFNHLPRSSGSRLDTQVWSCDSPVYSSSVASHRSSCEVQGRYKIHKVLPAEMPACISVVFPASLFLLFHTRLVGFFFSSPLPCCDLPGLSIFAPAISSALFPISVLRSQLKRDLLGDVPWSTHPWSTPVNHQALLCKLSDTSTCLIGSGRRRSPVRHARRKSPRERACENTHS